MNLHTSIRVAKEEDVLAIIEIEEKTWISTYPNQEAGITKKDIRARFSQEFKEKRAQEIKDRIANNSNFYLLAVKDGKIVGYSHGLKEKEFNDFVEIYVLDEYQGQGIGSALIKDTLARLDNSKPTRLEVASYNDRAKKVYEYFGFRENLNLHQALEEDWNVLPSGVRIPVVFMEREQSV